MTEKAAPSQGQALQVTEQAAFQGQGMRLLTNGIIPLLTDGLQEAKSLDSIPSIGRYRREDSYGSHR